MPTREVARQHRKSSDYSCVTTSDSQDRAGSKWTAVQHAWEAVPHRCKGSHVEKTWCGLATRLQGSTFPFRVHTVRLVTHEVRGKRGERQELPAKRVRASA